MESFAIFCTDVVVADSRRLDDIRWVFLAGHPVVANGALTYR
jgi:hypothetical protein